SGLGTLTSLQPHGDAGRRQAAGPGGTPQHRKTVRVTLGLMYDGWTAQNGMLDTMRWPARRASPTKRSSAGLVPVGVSWRGGLVNRSSVKKILFGLLDSVGDPGKLEGLPRGRGPCERVSARWVSVS